MARIVFRFSVDRCQVIHVALSIEDPAIVILVVHRNFDNHPDFYFFSDSSGSGMRIFRNTFFALRAMVNCAMR